MRKQNAKQRILAAAGNLFTKRGYGSVGINEIIAQSETAKASFYNHFPSKEQLCTAWLGETHDQSEERHEARLASGKNPLSLVEEQFQDLKPWMRNNGFRGCPYTNTAAGLPEDSPLIQEKVDQHKLYLRDFFIELAQRITSGKAARQLGTTLFLLYSGATTEAQNLKSTWPIDAAKDAAVALCENAAAHASQTKSLATP